MGRLQERHFWMGLVLGWVLLVAMAQVLAGCGDPLAAAPQACAPGEVASEGGGCEPRKPCAPGELTLESGECQPAGLPPDMQCPPGELALANGGCQPAGLPPDMQCPPGELALANGGCQPAGVPPEACGEGFVPDGDRGCEPILPAEVCPPGLMAIPGETTCREVAPCGDGPWGTIPVEANTQFVDQAYAGGDSDGTAARPWTTVQDGVDAAEDGAIVAVTDGTYVEDVLIGEKAVRLWGRCPGRVEIQGAATDSAAILVRSSGADGSEIRGLSVTGPERGITVSGVSHVAIEAVRVHGAARRGIEIEDVDGPTSVGLMGSLIELNHEDGVFVWGAHAAIEGTVVRSTQPVNGQFGRGINVQDDAEIGARGYVTILASVIEQNHDFGVRVQGSDAAIEGTVIRFTQPLEGHYGWGIEIINSAAPDQQADVIVRACVVDQNHQIGIFIVGAHAEIESTVVRSTQPINGMDGWGIAISDDTSTGARAELYIRACLVDHNHGVGMMVAGSDAEIEGTVVRSTQPDVIEHSGYGIVISDRQSTGERANVSIRASLAEQNHLTGVYIGGSDAEIEGTVVRSTQPVDGVAGRGIAMEDNSVTGERAKVSVRDCLVEQNHDAGVFVGGSDVEIEGTVVRFTQPVNDRLGFGVAIQDSPRAGVRANVRVRACLVEQNHDAGVFVGGSDVEIEGTVVRFTQPVGADFGRGIGIQDDLDNGERADVSIRASLVEDNHDVGVFILNSRAEIEATVVRNTHALDGKSGIGISIQGTVGVHADASVRSCLVERNRQAGLAVVFSSAVIEATIVRDTGSEDDGGFGDGITIESGAATVRAGDVTGNARAGIANWGSEVKIVSTIVACNKIDVNGEALRGAGASFDGSSDWRCSRYGAENCADTGACSVTSAYLEPPPPLQPLDPPPVEPQH